MKKTVALLLALLTAFMLTACSENNADSKPENAFHSEKTQQVSRDTKKDTPSTTKRSTEQKNPEPATTTPPQTEPAITEPVLVFEEFTAIDNESCIIKITGIEEDPIWGYTLKVYLENKTPDKELMFSVSDGAVNGVSWDPFFATEVAAGKKKNDEIQFSDKELEALIPTFTDIELSLRVYDSDDWLADDVANETIHIYPYGEENATSFVREPLPTDTVIVDNDQISIIVTGYDNDSLWGYSAKVYLVNKTNVELMFSCDDASVNGFMCDPFWATSVSPGKVGFDSIDWSTSSLEENGITDVEEIEMSIRVYDNEDWSSDDIYENTVILNP